MGDRASSLPREAAEILISMSTNGRWIDRRSLGTAIKATLFQSNSNRVDPREYTKSTALQAKRQHKQFSSVEDEEWFTAFRRAASEYNLVEDYKNIKGRVRSPTRPSNHESAASQPPPNVSLFTCTCFCFCRLLNLWYRSLSAKRKNIISKRGFYFK